MLAAILAIGLQAWGTGAAAQAPRPGGELVFVVAETPPSFDGHRETTFALLHPIAPHYSTLLRFDPEHYPKIAGDVAESWTVSRDGLTYTFKVRKGIKFHDGQPLRAQDVKATYDKIIFPPEGVASARKASYAAVDRVEAPDDTTVVFRLKHPSASFLANLASPWNFIYSAEKLKQDPRWYEKNVLGTGPFKLVEYVPGLSLVGKRNPDYLSRIGPTWRGTGPSSSGHGGGSRPFAGTGPIEFRGFSPAARDDLRRPWKSPRRPGEPLDLQLDRRHQQREEALHRRPGPPCPHPGH
jgi:peptide/nickel transport system substrate-binding protein